MSRRVHRVQLSGITEAKEDVMKKMLGGFGLVALMALASPAMADKFNAAGVVNLQVGAAIFQASSAGALAISNAGKATADALSVNAINTASTTVDQLADGGNAANIAGVITGQLGVVGVQVGTASAVALSNGAAQATGTVVNAVNVASTAITQKAK